MNKFINNQLKFVYPCTNDESGLILIAKTQKTVFCVLPSIGHHFLYISSQISIP